MDTKDEAIHKALKVLNCLNNDRVYETAWVKGAINACEEALEQPAQEPVAWINVKDKLPPQESNFLSFSETFGYQVSMYSSNPLNSTGLPTLERLKITKWMPIPHITLSAPSWQGLSDDEIDEQIEKASIPQYQGMDVTATNLRQFAKNILNIVKVKNND